MNIYLANNCELLSMLAFSYYIYLIISINRFQNYIFVIFLFTCTKSCHSKIWIRYKPNISAECGNIVINFKWNKTLLDIFLNCIPFVILQSSNKEPMGIWYMDLPAWRRLHSSPKKVQTWEGIYCNCWRRDAIDNKRSR